MEYESSEVSDDVALTQVLLNIQNQTSASEEQRDALELSGLDHGSIFALHKLCPRATKAAFKLLDSASIIEASVDTEDLEVLYRVPGHRDKVHFVTMTPFRPMLPTYTLCCTQRPALYACDCPAYGFTNEESFCKHIVAAGVAAATGIVRVRTVSHEVFQELLGQRQSMHTVTECSRTAPGSFLAPP